MKATNLRIHRKPGSDESVPRRSHLQQHTSHPGPRGQIRLTSVCPFACGLVSFLATSLLFAQSPELTPVLSRPISRTIDLPGEFQPYLSVALHAKIAGYVEKITVDRGSVVKQGDLLVDLSAPEIRARIAEAESKVQAADADRLQAEAQL